MISKRRIRETVYGNWTCNEGVHTRTAGYRKYRLKAGPLRLKQLTNTLKIRILSQTTLLYLIRNASVILIVGLHLQIRMPTSQLCWKKSSGDQRARTRSLEIRISRSLLQRSAYWAISPIRSTVFNLAKYRQRINITRGCAMHVSYYFT